MSFYNHVKKFLSNNTKVSIARVHWFHRNAELHVHNEGIDNNNINNNR